MIRMYSRCDDCANRDTCSSSDKSYYESRTCPNYR